VTDAAPDGTEPDIAEPPRPGRPRRIRSVTESLLSIVLVLEAFLLFFVTLVVFGLKVLEPLPTFVGGGVFMLVLAGLAGLQRFRGAVWAGAVVQLAIIATGILIPLMYAIGAGFTALWVWCFVRARQIESQQRAVIAAADRAEPTGSAESIERGENE
jgi:hypothetical protein